MIAAHVLIIDEEEQRNECSLRRILRDASNPLDMPNSLFMKCFRINKDGFVYLLDVLQQALPEQKTCRSLPAIIKLSACLRFFAEGGYQTGVGNDHDIAIAQPTFSLVLAEVLNVYERRLCREWIKMPDINEKRTIAQGFFDKHRLPGVIGCIDGTHVSILAPSRDCHLFYNRKGIYSLNVMLICDNEQIIRYVDATHPGACHDAFIWNLSEAKLQLESCYNNGQQNFHLLGDSGYALEPWLMTPFRTTTEECQYIFNDVHKQCRNIIERTNGVLKGKFRCLLGARMLHYCPQKAIQIINVCCALHNICIKYKAWQDFEEVEAEPFQSDDIDGDNDQLYAAAANKRLHLANMLNS